DPLSMYMTDYFTIPVNLAGLPGLSLPCGVDKDGMPIGLQIIGPPFGEEQVLKAAYTYEQLAWPNGAGRQWRAGRGVAVAVRWDGSRVRDSHRSRKRLRAVDRGQ